MMRCALYARYSSDRQNPRSIDDQIKKSRRFAEDHSWTILEDYVFTDEAISGARTDRAGYQQLLKVIERSIKENLIDIVLVEDTSRLWRDQEEQSRVLKLMKFAGVRLVGCDGSDSASPSSALFLGVKGLINQEAREEIGTRTRRGLRGTAEEGLHTGGRCFGYRSVALEKCATNSKKNPTKLVIDPEQAAIVTRIFEMYADGYSLKAVAKKLNADRVISPQPQLGRIQRSWAPSSIRVILHNDRYRGIVTFGKTKKILNPLTEKRIKRAGTVSEMVRKEFPEQRIVSESLWNRVQARIETVKKTFGDRGRRGGLTRLGSAGNTYLFSGLLKCAECGANLVLVSGRGKNHEQPDYGCPMNTYRGTCSNNVRIRKDVLETQMLSKLQNEVLREEVIEYALSRFESELKKAARGTDYQMSRLDDKRKRLEKELRNLSQAVASGLDSATIRQEIGDRERQLKEISHQVLSAKPETVRSQIKDLRKYVESSLKEIRHLFNTDTATTKAMLARHMPKIILKPNVKPDGTKTYIVASEWRLLAGGQHLTRMECAEGQS